ncbi:MAG: hypothetical protein ACREDX_07530, partial [Aestuariivirga sp.]
VMDERLRTRLPRIVLSGLAMGAMLLAATALLAGNYSEGAGFMAALAALLILVAGGSLCYFLIAHATGAMRLGEFRSMLKR